MKNKVPYQPEILASGDTLKQLLVRSCYLLFKYPGKWSVEQNQRADLLFGRYPILQKVYQLASRLEIFTGSALPKSRPSKDWLCGTMR